MFFNSIEFAVFFPIVVGLYLLTPERFRWTLLLAASYYFYAAWKAEYLILILASTLIDYLVALRMEKAGTKASRRSWLIVSLCSNLGILFSFKYFNFFNESTRALFRQFNILYDVPALEVLLPVGISFYTFQTLSYTIDVYRGQRPAERHLGIFALYVAFFPQLVAGPIERSTRLLPQFFKKVELTYERTVEGLRLMLWGFFKKLVIADRVAAYVDIVYGSPAEHSGFTILIATYFFAFQIFCDFSGYSDIAIGTARILGYDLMDNFKRPYFSKSIAEFWRRWHISLSTWFRDYLYIPLGGNRVVKWRWYYNLFIVFLISGLWHGANWTFVVWGALHGAYIILSIVTQGIRDGVWERLGLGARIRRWFAILVTFHLVTFSWIFFRADSIGSAFTLIQNMFDIGASTLLVGSFGMYEMVLAVGSILVLELVHILERRARFSEWLDKLPSAARWTIYYAVTMSILLFGVIDQKQAFIYFQF
jgi:D-alanyl-lipoteichoic acid acyltransferase DltB (MBOAT superfamily)